MFVSSKNCHNLLKTSSEFIFVRNKFEKVRTTNKMLKQRNYCKTAAIGSKVYCFGGYDSEIKALNTCEAYCRKSGSWYSIAPLPEYLSSTFWISICSFMNNVYVFGDLDFNNWVYDPSQNNWQKIAKMNVERTQSSCAVFQGQCVVLGGGKDFTIKALKTVESYDHYLNKWSFLSNMHVARLCPGVLSKGNKLYVISGFDFHCSSVESCEVCDSI